MRGNELCSVLTLGAHTSRFGYPLAPLKTLNVSGFGVKRHFRKRGGRNNPALIREELGGCLHAADGRF